jgi:hypothetical protein
MEVFVEKWEAFKRHFQAEVDWDQKAFATIHTKKFRHFVWEIVKAPAPNVTLLLWTVRPCFQRSGGFFKLI